jgi:DNA-binding NarL/FixJ family response regulator
MPKPSLTERMQQVLEGIARGQTNKEIGSHLGISHKTVEKYRAQLYGHYQVNNAVSLVVAALKEKAIKL